ncbi:MAG: TonB-dependent receptor domain-containing protein, partial [Candidatus Acidiferrales bacterium]
MTNTTVDGVNLPSPEPGVRQIKLDALPAGIVDNVVVSKTLQANMEGDGIGGSVDFRTASAPAQPTISITSFGGYTPIIHGRGLTQEIGSFGDRFGADKRFGLVLTGSYDWNGRGIDDVEPVPDIATLANGQQINWKDGTDIREYEYFRSRWGMAGKLDYKIGSDSSIYLDGLYSDFHNYGDRYDYSLVDNTPGIQLLNPGNVGCSTASSGVTTTNCTGGPSYNAQLRNPDIGLGALILGGRHDLNTSWFAWDVSAARSFYGNSPYSTASFNSNLSSSSCQYDPANTVNEYLPRWTGSCYTEAYNPNNYTLSGINRDLGLSAQVNLQAEGSGAKRYHIGSRLATIEAGVEFRNVHKFNNGYVLTYNPVGTIPMSAFPSRLSNSNYYNGGQYPLGYNVRYEDVITYANANPSAFTTNSTQGADGQDYDLVEKVTAGYVMNTIDLSSKLRFIAGLRIEATSDNVTNFAFGSFPCPSDPTTTCSSINPNQFSGSYISFLPSASVRYTVTQNDNIRFLYARGLSRPDEQDLAQAEQWTDSGNGANRYSVNFGNAGLKAETGDDFDILWDHYFSTFGALSAGYFYKRLQDPIVYTSFQLVNFQPPGGPVGNYLATQPVNAGSAWINGAEVSYLQHFSRLPGAWGGLGLLANYSYMKSRANGIPGRSDSPPLQRTSPNAFNLSPTYDRGRVSIRVGMSYNQGSIYAYQ